VSEQRYDRSADDVGNLVEIGHVNVNIANQADATDFYVTALGLTRDPFLMTGTGNMWVNVGRHQLHLPTAERAQCLRGCVGIVVPDLGALRARLTRGGYAYADTADGLEARSPWGNRIRAHAPDARFGPITLGLGYVEFDAPAGSAAEIARFYTEIVGAPAILDAEKRTASIRAGDQQLVFRESDAPLPAYDGYHIQVYLADFSAPHRRLGERGLISRESGPHEYRFVDIVSLDDGRPLLQLEHEVRSLRHPLFGRALVNRDPALNPIAYVSGREAYVWASDAH
jgi:catechol-2,3-dioxygenase